MFKKKIILILIFCFSFVSTYATETNSKTTGTGGRDDFSHLKAKNSNFKKGNNAFKQAKKYDRKGKLDKAKKRFNDAINFFVLANEESPNNLIIINRLGYSFQEVGDFAMAEIYYEQGLQINPLHVGINEYLGELYIQTNRIAKAKERLKVLGSCNCEEFEKLKNLISKY